MLKNSKYDVFVTSESGEYFNTISDQTNAKGFGKYKVFTNNGYTICNGGKFGKFNTLRNIPKGNVLNYTISNGTIRMRPSGQGLPQSNPELYRCMRGCKPCA